MLRFLERRLAVAKFIPIVLNHQLMKSVSLLSKRLPLFLTFCAWGLLVLVSGCQSTSPKIPARFTADRVPGTIAPGDTLRFAYLGDPGLNESQLVSADGKVSLASVGEVTAAGKRLGAFQKELAQLYKPYLTNNEVIVWAESSSAGVSVSGAVNKPGEVPIDHPITLFEAIQKAGGLSNLANDRKVLVVRTENNHHYSQTFDLSGIRKGKEMPVFFLRPYDAVQVPERFF